MSYWEEALNKILACLRRHDFVSAENNNSDESGPTFTLFPQLPTELRLKIWKEAIPGEPRVIIFKLKGKGLSDPRIHAAAKTPAIFQTNQESRQVGLGVYELAFKSILERLVYIDYRMDAVYMQSPYTFEAFCASVDPSRGGSATAEEIRDMESKLRCLILGFQLYWRGLTAALALRNIESLIFRVYGSACDEKLNEDTKLQYLSYALHIKEFAEYVVQSRNYILGPDTKLPQVLFARDVGREVKVQSWDVRALCKLQA
jgi:hypothetical protein